VTPGLRTFYILVFTQVFSKIGSKISSLAVAVWIFSQTGDATPLAMVAFFITLPEVVAASISGVLADRWDRRKVLILADAGQAAGTLLLLVLVLGGDLQLWHLYLVTLIQSTFGIFQGPAFQASITMLVPDEHRDRANALREVTGPSAGLIAPVLAGIVYATVGLLGAIVIDLLTFIVAVIVVNAVHIPRPAVTAEGRAFSGTVWQESLTGWRYLKTRRPLLFLALNMALVNFLLGGAGAIVAAYILARTSSETTLGLLLGVMNLGAVVGGILMGMWGGTRPRIHTVLPGIILLGLFMAVIGIGQTAWVIGVGMFGIMFPLPFIAASYSSILQSKIPPDIQGRVFALTTQISLLLMPLAYLAVGPLADQVFEPAVTQPGWERFAPLVGSAPGSGMGLLIVIGGLLTAITSLIVYTLPVIRNVEANLPDYEAKSDDSAPADSSPAAEPALQSQ
jgi:MFS family permease